MAVRCWTTRWWLMDPIFVMATTSPTARCCWPVMAAAASNRDRILSTNPNQRRWPIFGSRCSGMWESSRRNLATVNAFSAKWDSSRANLSCNSAVIHRTSAKAVQALTDLLHDLLHSIAIFFISPREAISVTPFTHM